MVPVQTGQYSSEAELSAAGRGGWPIFQGTHVPLTTRVKGDVKSLFISRHNCHDTKELRLKCTILAVFLYVLWLKGRRSDLASGATAVSSLGLWLASQG